MILMFAVPRTSMPERDLCTEAGDPLRVSGELFRNLCLDVHEAYLFVSVRSMIQCLSTCQGQSPSSMPV